MNILSLYDGMACGHIAFMLEQIPIDRYVAYEIDGYAVKTAVHNFPDIEQRGDVFDGDFNEFEGFDWLVGGSPCTYWSIAQKNNRETEASGLGWELFCQYVRALKEAKPKFFIYENNKSMSKAIRDSITEAFGFEPVCINSALVSAQNRQRLYWVGRRNDDGTYSKVDVPQPEDRGILLKDILEGGELVAKDKAYCLKHQAGNARDYFKKHHTDIKFEPVGTTKDGKSFCFTAGYANGSGENIGNYAVHTLEKGCKSMAAEPVCVAQRGRYTDSGNRTVKGNGPIEQYYEARDDGKTNALTTVQKDNAVCEPVGITADGKAQCVRASCYKDGIRNLVGNDIDRRTGVAEPVNVTEDGKSQTIKAQYQQTSIANICCYTSTYGASGAAEPIRVGCMPSPDGELRNSQAFRVYSTDGKSVNLTSGGGGAGGKTGLYAIQVDEAMRVREATKQGYTDINIGDCVDMTQPNSKTRRGRNMRDKSNCCMTSCQYYQYVGKLGYATPCEWDEDGRPIKAVSCADGKVYTVYEVKDGKITIKGKEYPIKLVDGYYIIRKLTVRECMRLQTVPEWYEFPVSDTQAYKMLGNGWTVEVIRHLIRCAVKDGEQND